MHPNLKKYLWQFGWIYTVGYIIGIALSLLISHFWHLKLQDFIIMVSLSTALPPYIADKFIKNEGRYLNEMEQKIFVKKMSLIALSISIIPTLIYFGVGIILKLVFSAQDITALLATTPLSNEFKQMFSMNNAALIAILLGTSLLYYFFIRLSISWAFKSQRKKYTKKTLAA